MKIYTIILTLICTALISSCKHPDKEWENSRAIDKTVKAKGDKMIYGLICDGCTDSTIVFLSNEGGDPVTYNIIRATRNKQIFGKPEIGDWAGIMLNPNNKHEATMVVDLDQLKGTWTYQVMPILKEMATKSEHEIIAELTDSMKEEIFVPREYGFSLKRQFQAFSIGESHHNNLLDNESIVEYPPVKKYTEWHVYNGKLILVGDTADANHNRLPDNKIMRDTAEFVYMLGDSLVLKRNNEIVKYRRQAKAATDKNQKRGRCHN